MTNRVESVNVTPPATAPRRRVPVWLIVLLAVLAVVVVVVIINANPIYNTVVNLAETVFRYDRVAPSEVVQCTQNSACSLIHAVVFSLIFIVAILTGFAYTTLLERRFIAFFQQRVGPNRAGPMGLLQPVADGVKLIFKEDIEPTGVDKWVYRLAPIMKAVPAFILLAVIPLGPDLMIPWFDGLWYQVPLGLADPNVGILWLLGITSIGTYGVVLAGWSSNNKYSMLGGLRATAQMLSYELSLSLTMAVPILIASSMSVGTIIANQTFFYQWFVFQNPLAAGILFIALLAEISRSPFDLPEAEQELTQGYMTEYSGMKFALFMLSEYIGMIAISTIVISLYFGGYQDGFGIVNFVPILGPLVLIGKIILFLILMIWIRSTLPRFRYDRLMAFGWKVMLPLALIAVSGTAIALLVGDLTDSVLVYAIAGGIFFVLLMVGGYIVFVRGERSGAPERKDDWAEDPLISGERGLGWNLSQVLGGLLALPFLLFDWTLKILDGLATLGQKKPADGAATPGDSGKE
ncbi:MAG TPA: NADH-quinone oxidoreductase subunit NuoH [Candidatus Limnocylindrales bacterium]|nr:NADH-quinone oxidoreductase subunit NuoH [Candidatus Limnocylindrales bacterium]